MFYSKSKAPRYGMWNRTKAELTEFRYAFRRFARVLVTCSRCYFVQIQPISQKFNSCLTDGRTDASSHRDSRTHLKKDTSCCNAASMVLSVKRWWTLSNFWRKKGNLVLRFSSPGLGIDDARGGWEHTKNKWTIQCPLDREGEVQVGEKIGFKWERERESDPKIQ